MDRAGLERSAQGREDTSDENGYLSTEPIGCPGRDDGTDHLKQYVSEYSLGRPSKLSLTPAGRISAIRRSGDGVAAICLINTKVRTIR